MDKVLFQSPRHTWVTPQAFFDRLDLEFGFTLDVCSLPHNAKCAKYFTPDDDGLSQAWRGICWMNPPYGVEICKWMQKAYESSLAGCTVICLVPARVETEWWHRFAIKGEIRFLRGRLRFVGGGSCAPFPSAIIIFRDRWWERRDW